jgi:site-specific recombinase XerD
MSALAPSLQAWFTDRLANQLHASPNTVAAYRDAWRLLLGYLQQHTGKQPSQLDLADLDAPTISAFLDHLESDRHNSVRTRNARLAAIRSFFRFASLRHPEHAAVIAQVLAIPTKRGDHPEVSYLNTEEITALVDAPDPRTWTGRRDHALIDLAVQTGLRVSELTGLRNCDIELGVGAHVHCTGKGRKNRSTPLTKETVAVLRTWSRERRGGPDDPLFPSQQGGHLSRGGVEELVAKHATTAAKTCASITKKHPTPHVLRHSCVITPAVLA